MTSKVFLHGVPDTPDVWRGLVDALGLEFDSDTVPALPGFDSPLPLGFGDTKDDYVDWFIRHLERLFEKDGAIDVVAHDWGGLIALRAASLRPELFRTWAICNSVPPMENKWHKTARGWQTPILGELMMALTPKSALRKGLAEQGLPEHLAALEASKFDRTMRRHILKLYRTAEFIGTEWGPDFDNLPRNGAFFWGLNDKYVPLKNGQKFADERGFPLTKVPDSGHWMIAEKPDLLAELLRAHWGTA